MGAAIGTDGPTVSKWWQRDSIPGEWWYAVSRSRVARSNGVTLEVMARLAAAVRELPTAAAQ